MKFAEVAKLRRSEIGHIRERVDSYVVSVPKDALSAILLSGSVGRGDFYPGRLGGMIDLTVFKKPGSNIAAYELFGENENPEIPFHCVNRNGDWYQIWFSEMLNGEGFRQLVEARKFDLSESILLWQRDMTYSDADEVFKGIAAKETMEGYNERLSKIRYLLSEYKVDRWQRRKEPEQLHVNLSAAVDLAIGCLYNLNGKYAPAFDRMAYYSYELEIKPTDYGSLLRALVTVKIGSMRSYRNREQAFKTRFLQFLDESNPPDKSGGPSP